MTIDVLPDSDGMPAVLALWEAARERGWDVTPDPASEGWRGLSPDRTAGFEYIPPAVVSDGTVQMHCPRHTVRWTGVSTPAEAVVRIRDFFGWVAT